MQGQAGGKGLPATVTVQQLQQIVKSVAGSGQGQPTQQVWLSSSLIWWRALHLQNLPLRSSRTQFLPSLVLPVKLFRRESFLCPVLLQGRDNRQYRYYLHFSSYLRFRQLSLHHHLHPTNYGIAKRNSSSPLLSYPGSSSSTRHSTRKLAQRLPRPAWTASGERPCQRPSRRQPRQDPGPHGENLWKAHHIDYKSTIRVHHNSRSSHKCPLHLLLTAKTSQWPSERPSLALPPCKALASSGVSTTRRLLRAQQRQQQGSKWSTFN